MTRSAEGLLPGDWDIETLVSHPPEVRVFGRMIFDPIWAERMHPADAGCEILHLIGGRMELVMNDRCWPLGPGDTAMVPAGAMHRDAFDTAEDPDILFCAFTWPPADAYFRSVDNDTLAWMSSDRRTQLRAMFDQLRGDPAGERPVDRALLQVRLLAILLFILRQEAGDAPREVEDASRRLMLRAKEYIHNHYGECIRLDDIAAALHVSAYHLSHVFSRESDFTLWGYLMQVRMNEAKKLLLTGRLNVSEVARAVGYEDPNYFSKAFRKHVGLSPTEYAASKPSE